MSSNQLEFGTLGAPVEVEEDCVIRFDSTPV